MNKCNRKGCSNEAKWWVGFRVHGVSGEHHLDAKMSLMICDEHKQSTTIEDIVNPEIAAGMNNQLLANGKEEADFTTAAPLYWPIDGSAPELQLHLRLVN